MSDDRYLTFALGKGRLAKKTLQLFEQIGITCEEMKDPDTRKLIFVNEELKLRFFLAKGPDVPTYVEYGAADIGVVGKDTILEEGRNIYEVLDLGEKAMIGKGKRSKEVIDAVIRNKAVYFAAVGGAGALLSKCIKSSEVICYDDLGAEAIRKIYVEDFPVIVVIDSEGNNLYETSIKEFKKI